MRSNTSRQSRTVDRLPRSAQERSHPRIDEAVSTIPLMATSVSNAHKNRMHLDTCPVGMTQENEVLRLEQLGARRIDTGQGDVSLVVMEYPVGNEFFIVLSVLPPERAPFHQRQTPSHSAPNQA